jgi:anthranilate phosphoribosyltransferase
MNEGAMAAASPASAQPSSELRQLIQKVAGGAALTKDEIRGALEQMTAGAATAAQMGAFLMALRVRGETIEEITGAAQMLRARMNRVDVPADAIDIVGTGGDNHGTYNISTCAALLAAGAGAKVAKHGNRRVSSKSGASDVLAELGVKLDTPFEVIARCVTEAGLGFLWAPQHHPAMRHWAAIRGELGIRTIFNLLGPIANPGAVRSQIVGVFSRDWVLPIAEVLRNLGAEHVWVVHGHDGLDELTTTGATDVAELKDGAITQFEVTPADAGLSPARLADLRGGDEKENAAAIRNVLNGKRTPLRDIALLNAAAALIVADRAANLVDGAALAAHAIESGAAHAVLAKLIAISNGRA